MRKNLIWLNEGRPEISCFSSRSVKDSFGLFMNIKIYNDEIFYV